MSAHWFPFQVPAQVTEVHPEVRDPEDHNVTMEMVFDNNSKFVDSTDQSSNQSTDQSADQSTDHALEFHRLHNLIMTKCREMEDTFLKPRRLQCVEPETTQHLDSDTNANVTG